MIKKTKVIISDYSLRLHTHLIVEALINSNRYEVILYTTYYNSRIVNLIKLMTRRKIKTQSVFSYIEVKNVGTISRIITDLIYKYLRFDIRRLSFKNFFNKVQKISKSISPDVFFSLDFPDDSEFDLIQVDDCLIIFELSGTLSNFKTYILENTPNSYKDYYFKKYKENHVAGSYLKVIEKTDILVVPSSFVLESSNAIIYNTIRRNPIQVKIANYGVDEIPSTIRESNVINVVYVGRTTFLKGFSVTKKIIDYFYKNDKIKFTIIGDVDSHSRIILKEYSNVEIIGRLDRTDLLNKLLEMDLLLHPTLSEGFSYTILEALNAGLITITTTNSGFKDIITDRYDGFITGMFDHKNAIQIIEELMYSSELANMIKKNARFLGLKYNKTRYVRRMTIIFNQIFNHTWKERNEK